MKKYISSLFFLAVISFIAEVPTLFATCPPRSGFTCIENGNTYVYTSIATTVAGTPVETNVVFNASAIVDDVTDAAIDSSAATISNPSAAATLSTVADSNIGSSSSAGSSPTAGSSSASASAGSSGPTIIFTTEKIPGANCRCVAAGSAGDLGSSAGPVMPDDVACGNPQTRKYRCEVQKGMVSFQYMIRDITKWFVYIIMLLGVLALVGAGILWAMGSDSEEYTKKAKGWAKNIIIGLVILFTFRYILGFLAPWIFQ